MVKLKIFVFPKNVKAIEQIGDSKSRCIISCFWSVELTYSSTTWFM